MRRDLSGFLGHHSDNGGRTGTFQNHSKSLSNCKQASYVDANKFISKDGANKGFYEIALSFLGNSLQAAISSLHIAAPGQ